MPATAPLLRSSKPKASPHRSPAVLRYLPQVASFDLESILRPVECQDLLIRLAESAAGDVLRQEIPSPCVCDLDQAWVRRQYPPHRRPAGRVPHSWHQDGALRYPFDPAGIAPPSPDGLLPMVTCWIALTPCGQQSPGLEFVRRRFSTLLPPIALMDEAVHSAFPAEQLWRPSMAPGDALLFSGGTLHRTHVTPGMTEDRTSLELRFFPARPFPERLAGDRVAPLFPA